VTISVNGKPTLIETPRTTVTDILVLHNVRSPEVVSVQLNGDFLEHRNFASTYLDDGDEVEILYFMSGGERG